ncbi:hypothetical protein [Riemerella columbina]|uniref:hypothetical protein n=1 Tax=Riemerella columbina TaxID=103810 RepID=UPI000370F4F4|nr:hypothetical protein [Riemerella columbina]
MKYIVLTLGLMMHFSCAQQLKINTPSETRKIEVNKKDFIGKPLNQLLSSIKVPIKSVLPIPNKNSLEVNRICLRYLEEKEFGKTLGKDINNRPTQICVTFNQNWDLHGKRCIVSEDPDCFEWTKKDEKNLGNLIIYNIEVFGKN